MMEMKGINDFKVEIEYTPEFLDLLKKEPKVSKLIKIADTNLRTINGCVIKEDPNYCLKAADNAISFYNKASMNTKYIYVMDCCFQIVDKIEYLKREIINPFL